MTEVGTTGGAVSWGLVALGVVLVLACLVLGIFVWRRRARANGASNEVDPSAELLGAWSAVWRDLSARERRSGAVVLALGEVWRRSGALAALVDAPQRGAPESSSARAYRGARAAVLEVPDELLRVDGAVLERALRTLGRRLPPLVLVTLGIDVRELSEGDERRLDAWASFLGRALPRLAQQGRVVGLKVGVAGLESEPGYPRIQELWVRQHSDALSFDLVGDGPRLDELFRRLERQLGSVLVSAPEEFEGVVTSFGSLPRRLAVLAEGLRAVKRVSEGRTQTSLGGVFLTDARGSAVPAFPFTPSESDLQTIRVELVRASWERAARWAVGGCAALVLGFCVHGLWLGRVHAKVLAYAEVASSRSRGPGETEPPRGPLRSASRVELHPSSTSAGGDASLGSVSEEGGPRLLTRAEEAGRAVRGLEHWALPLAWTSERSRTTEEFVRLTRQTFIVPLVDSRRHFTGRVFAAVLDRATPTNEFGELVLAHPESWAKALRLPRRTVEDFVRVRTTPVRSELSLRDLDLAARSVGEWRKVVLEVTSAVGEGIFSEETLRRARENPLVRELPTSAAELLLLERAVRLLAEDLVEGRGRLALEDELKFVAQNLDDLVALRAWLDEVPPLGTEEAPAALGALVERVVLPRAEAPAEDQTLEIHFEGRQERISRLGFQRAVAGARARAAYRAFLVERCGGTFTEERLLQECPYARAGYDGSWFFSVDAASGADEPAVSGALSGRRIGELPDRFTRAAYEAHVAPVLTKLSERLQESALPPTDRRGLLALVEGHADAYGERYVEALRSYFLSPRMAPVSLNATKAAVEELTAEGSWFQELVATVAHQAALSAEGSEASGIRGALRSLAGLVAAGEAKGLEPYMKLLRSVASDAAASEENGVAVNKRLRAALGVLDVLERTAADRELAAWLDSAQITGEWRKPFELPVELLRSHALMEIRSYWYQELVRPALPLLRQYPFSAGEAAASVDSVTEEFGPSGRLWATVEEALSPIVTARRSRNSKWRRDWVMRSRVSEPEGLLEYLRAAERLTTLLWSASGERRAVSLGLTPLALPSGTVGEPLIALAHLSLAGAGVQSFNQVTDETLVEVPWWSREASTLSVEILNESASEIELTEEVASATGPWSFLKLLDGGRAERARGASGNELAWSVRKLPGKPSVRFELTEEVDSVFRDLRRLADEAGDQRP